MAYAGANGAKKKYVPGAVFAGSNGAIMKFVGGANFAKFGLFCPENCNFAHNFKGIAAMRLILVSSISKWPMLLPMVQK